MAVALTDRLQTALALAREAGDITLHYFCQNNYEVQLKADATPVTAADRQAEQHVRRRLGELFPDDGVLGEEFPEQQGRSGCRWIVDPIDGTKSFVSGVPLYGTLIAVECQGRAVLGVVHLPALGETVYAADGEGAWHVRRGGPPAPARVSSTTRLADCLFCTSDARSYHARDRSQSYDRLQSASRLTRTWGDCYGYVLVATGRADIMIDPVVSIWDLAALQPIIEEAGGKFTDWQGRATIHSGDAVATNGLVHAETLSLLGAPKEA